MAPTRVLTRENGLMFWTHVPLAVCVLCWIYTTSSCEQRPWPPSWYMGHIYIYMYVGCWPHWETHITDQSGFRSPLFMICCSGSSYTLEPVSKGQPCLRKTWSLRNFHEWSSTQALMRQSNMCCRPLVSSEHIMLGHNLHFFWCSL